MKETEGNGRGFGGLFGLALIEREAPEEEPARLGSYLSRLEPRNPLQRYSKVFYVPPPYRGNERFKLQVLLTAAGYWPAVPDAAFNTRLFNAILKFEVYNGFAPLGILTSEQMDRLMAIAGPYLNAWKVSDRQASDHQQPGLGPDRSASDGGIDGNRPHVFQSTVGRRADLRLLSPIHLAPVVRVFAGLVLLVAG